MDDVPQDSDALRDWLRDLKEASDLSFEQIGQAIGEEPRSVKRWLRATGKATLPSGDVILRLLSALGVTFTPSQPHSLKAVNQAVEDLRLQIERDLASLRTAKLLDEYRQTGIDPLAKLVEVVTELAEDQALALDALDVPQDVRARRGDSQAQPPVVPTTLPATP